MSKANFDHTVLIDCDIYKAERFSLEINKHSDNCYIAALIINEDLNIAIFQIKITKEYMDTLHNILDELNKKLEKEAEFYSKSLEKLLNNICLN